MIPPITREEHYQVLLKTKDPIEYCREIFYMKTNSSLPKNLFYTLFELWLKTKIPSVSRYGRSVLIYGSTKIHNFFLKKFA